MDVFSANAALAELTEKEALAFVLLQQVLLLGCTIGAGGETRQGVFPVNNVLSAVGEVGCIFPANAQPTQHAADCREHRSCLTLAMLLYADPLTLPVPLEVDLFPEGLYADLREVFAEQRRVLGIG